MYAIVKLICPALVNRKRAILQQDSARPHTARATRNKLQELGGIELMSHPTCSPDIAPSNYYLFRSMTPCLQSRRNKEEVGALIKKFLTSQDKNWYQYGIKILADWWLQVVQCDGLYSEC
ncbi:histone-lysine N-methyltransferase SETMAR-like [Octopus bimaculoides]|uniref:histone-lysine N-methyltransferase SETMAR-like n=1 Tax=Octopus bimaculoides TaxID=37653 RepID=UPI00071D9E3C|nr:histone-lysine N-methyltransferase SETMAR-like [Octopus bimaculoides]|eukprot:XP_014791252.1 PREDICTED: histone-lysine N-methyltransferase SETMAR-like [Octopus bimaculoides]